MKIFRAVLLTELRNILRNKRALIGTFIPIILVPLVMFLAGRQMNQVTAGNEETLKIAIVNESTDTDKEIISFLDERIFSNEMIATIEKKESAVKQLEDGKKSLIVTVQDIPKKNKEKKYQLTVVFNTNSITSTVSSSMIQNRIDSYNNEQKEVFLKKYGEEYNNLDVVPYESVALSNYTDKKDSELNPTLALIMPMLILVFVINGGSGICVDLLAGEKERGSLEALLATKADRKYILLAKMITAVLMAIVTSTLTTVGYSVAMIYSIGSGFHFPIANFIYLVLTALITAFIATSVNCYISINAQTTREAHSKVAIFCILPTMVGAVNMFASTGAVPKEFYAVPFLNAFYLFRDAYSSVNLNIGNLMIALISSIVVVGMFIKLSVNILNGEQVMLGKQKK